MEARKAMALPIATHGRPSHTEPATPVPAEIQPTAAGVAHPSAEHQEELPPRWPASRTPPDGFIRAASGKRMGGEQSDAGESQRRRQRQPPQHHQYQQQQQQFHQRQYQQQPQQQYRQQLQTSEGHGGDMGCSLPLPDGRQCPTMSLWQDPEDQALAEECDGCYSEDDSTVSTDLATCASGGDEGEGNGGGGETQPGSSCGGDGRSDFQMDTCDSLPADPPACEGAVQTAAEAAGTDSGATAPAGGHAVRQGPRNAATVEDQGQASDDGGGAGTGSSYVVGGGGAGGGSSGGGGGPAGDVGGTTSSSRADGGAGGSSFVREDGADGAGDGSHSRGSSFAPPPAAVRGAGCQPAGALDPAAAGRSEERKHEGAEAEAGVSGDSASPSPVRRLGCAGGGGGCQAGPTVTGQRRQSCSGGGTQLQPLAKRRCLDHAPADELPPPDASCHGGAGPVGFADPAGQQQHPRHLQQQRQQLGRSAAAVAVEVSAAAAGFSAALPYKQRNASQGSATSGGGNSCYGSGAAAAPAPAPPSGSRVRPDPVPAPPPPAPSLPHLHHPHRGVGLPPSLAPPESPRTPLGAPHSGNHTPTPCSSSWAPKLLTGALHLAIPQHPADLGLMPCGPPSTHSSESFFHLGSSPAGAPGCSVVGTLVSPGSRTAPISPATTLGAVAAAPAAPSLMGPGVGSQRSHFCRCPACCPGGGRGMGYNSAGGSAGSGYAGHAAGSLGASGCDGVARAGSAGSGGSAGFGSGADGVVLGAPVQGRPRESELAAPGFATRLVDGQGRTGCPTAPAVPVVRHGFSGPDASRRQCQLPPGSVLPRAIIGTIGGSTTISLTPSDSAPAGVVHVVHAPSAAGQTRAPAALPAPPPLRYPMPPCDATGRQPPLGTLYGSAGAMVQCACTLCVSRMHEQQLQQQQWSSSSPSSLLLPAPGMDSATVGQAAATASAAAAATAPAPETAVHAPRWTTPPARNVSLAGVRPVLPPQPASAQPPGSPGPSRCRQLTTGHLHLQPSHLPPSRSGHEPCSAAPFGQTRDELQLQQRPQEGCAQEQQQQQGHPQPEGQRQQQQQPQGGAAGLFVAPKPSNCSLGKAVVGQPETPQPPASYGTASVRAASAAATTAHTSSTSTVAGFPAPPQHIQLGSGPSVVSESSAGVAPQPKARGMPQGTPSVSAQAQRHPRSAPSAPGHRPPPQPLEVYRRRYSEGAAGCGQAPVAVLVSPRQVVTRTLSTGRELLRQNDNGNGGTARVEAHRPSTLSGCAGLFSAGGASGGAPAPYSVPNGVVQSPAVNRLSTQAMLCGGGVSAKAAPALSATTAGLYGSQYGSWGSGRDPAYGPPGRHAYTRLPTFSAAAAAAAATAGSSYPSFGVPEHGVAAEPVRISGGGSGSGPGAVFGLPPQTAVRGPLHCGQGTAVAYPTLSARGAAAATAPAGIAARLAATSPLSAARPCSCLQCQAAFLRIQPQPPLRPQ